MDSGWAVVLGAFIALTGSALIPWLRDSRAEARARKERAETRRRDAVIDLIARNSGIAIAVTFTDQATLLRAFEARDEAATRLLLEVEEAERDELLPLLQGSIPSRQGQDLSVMRTKSIALQNVLVRWASGELETAKLRSTYGSLTKQG